MSSTTANEDGQMSELRQDRLSREWTILAPERGRRPHETGRAPAAPEGTPDWDKDCPFCRGNEASTPDEVLRIPASAGPSDWTVRVVPNKFPALTAEGAPVVERRGSFRRANGVGVHEVIIETPSHSADMAHMSSRQVENILAVYKARYEALQEDRRFKFISVFKNWGWASGTSLRHPHSQLIATPIPAPYYHRRLLVAMGHYADTGRCLHCDVLADEVGEGSRVVAETEHFVALHPYASPNDWETHITSREHHAAFSQYPDAYLPDLAKVLKETLLVLYHRLRNPAFNLVIDSAAAQDDRAPYYHCHLRVVPRLSFIAGFEMGSGIRIRDTYPEDTAKEARRFAASLSGGRGPSRK